MRFFKQQTLLALPALLLAVGLPTGAKPVKTKPILTKPTAVTGQIVGNTKTHLFHVSGDKKTLPARKYRIYFRTVTDALAAGYHPSGTHFVKPRHAAAP